MKKLPTVTRREMLGASFVLALPVLALACSKKETGPSCMDTAGLKPDEVQMRKTMAYTDAATDPAKRCDQCQLFKPTANAQACGACTLLKGDIHPGGSCTAWAKKA